MLRAFPFLCGLSALLFTAPVAAQSETDLGNSPAVAALHSLANHCLVDHTATSLQKVLLDEKWSRIGGIHSESSSANLSPETKRRLEEAKASNDRWRTFIHDDHKHMLTYTTPIAFPDEIASCVIDGKDLDVANLVRLMVRVLGVPEEGESPSDPRWRGALNGESEVRIAKSMIVGNDNGISVVVTKTTSVQRNKNNSKEQ